jgi:hypothetical protein
MARTNPECHAILSEGVELLQNLGGTADEVKEPSDPAGSAPLQDRDLEAKQDMVGTRF